MTNPTKLLSCNISFSRQLQQVMQILFPNGVFLLSLVLVELSEKSGKCQQRGGTYGVDWTKEREQRTAYISWDQG